MLESEVKFQGYEVYRCDRSLELVTDKVDGGGVLIAVNCSIYNSKRITTNANRFDQLFVRVSKNSQSIIIGAAYFGQNCSSDDYLVHANTIDHISNNNPNCDFALFGDYNLPNIKWTSHPLSFHYTAGYKENVISSALNICDTFASLGLRQVHPLLVPNRDYTLDLAFTSIENLHFVPSDETIRDIDAHHPPASFSLMTAKHEDPPSEAVYYDFKGADYELINEKLNNVNWSNLISCDNCEDKVKLFYVVLSDIVSTCVPLKRFFVSRYPKWFSKELIDNLKLKSRAHWIYKCTRRTSDYNEFKRLRSHCNFLREQCRHIYLEDIQDSLPYDMKKFWHFTNNQKSNLNIPTSLFLGDATAIKGHDIVRLFATHFESFYSSVALSDVHQSDSPTIIDSIEISITDVFNLLNNLNTRTSPGPDGIPAVFLRNCSSQLTIPLHHIFNCSLEQGYFPILWKASFVKPILKSGDPHNIANYRPISVLNACAKLFDELVTNKIYDVISHLIIPQQHGFFKGRSTVTNLAVFTHSITNAINNSLQVDVIYNDYSKAFDSINHKRLIGKLYNLGIRGSSLSWLQSYLQGRSQSVKIKNCISDIFPVPSGVPQGSHLGPILFLLFVNDITSCFKKATFSLYADDLKIYSCINNVLDATAIQRDLIAFTDWSNANGLVCNPNKCKVMSYSRRKSNLVFEYELDGTVISRTTSIRDLGVTFTNRLDFSLHLNEISSKASKLLGFIYRSTREFSNPKSLIYLYKSLVVPVLMYASQIWSPYELVDIKRIESVQHRFLRMLSYKIGEPMHPFDHDYSIISARFNISSLESLRNYSDIIFAFNILQHKINCISLNDLFQFRALNYTFRNARLLYEFNYKSNYSFESMIPRLVRLFNALPLEIRNINSLYAFKAAVKNLILLPK